MTGAPEAERGEAAPRKCTGTGGAPAATPGKCGGKGGLAIVGGHFSLQSELSADRKIEADANQCIVMQDAPNATGWLDMLGVAACDP